MAEPWLTALADRLGVACAYHDWTGNFVTVQRESVVAVLAALGVRADTEEDCAASLSDIDRAQIEQLRLEQTAPGKLDWLPPSRYGQGLTGFDWASTKRVYGLIYTTVKTLKNLI